MNAMSDTPDQAMAHAAELPKSDLNLVWIDCEMSGLDPEKERLLEIAVIVTGPQLEPRIEGPVLVIHQSDAVLNAMDAWNKGTHGKSGLIDKVKASTLTEAEAEQQQHGGHHRPDQFAAKGLLRAHAHHPKQFGRNLHRALDAGHGANLHHAGAVDEIVGRVLDIGDVPQPPPHESLDRHDGVLGIAGAFALVALVPLIAVPLVPRRDVHRD